MCGQGTRRDPRGVAQAERGTFQEAGVATSAAETEGRRLWKCNVPGDLQNQPCRMLGTEVLKRVWEARQDGWQEPGLRGSVD